MRKIARLRSPVNDIRRLMVFDSGDGTYLFMYSTDEDSHCDFDDHYATLAQAVEVATAVYRAEPEDWEDIPDPRPGCQHDWIQPTRVRVDDHGKKRWGEFEVLRDGRWVPVPKRR